MESIASFLGPSTSSVSAPIRSNRASAPLLNSWDGNRSVVGSYPLWNPDVIDMAFVLSNQLTAPFAKGWDGSKGEIVTFYPDLMEVGKNYLYTLAGEEFVARKSNAGDVEFFAVV